MKKRFRLFSLLCSGSLAMSSASALLSLPVHAANAPDKVVHVKTSSASTFHDTDGDGLGEFEGWGTSLCWWANRVGNNAALSSEAAEKFFSDSGLDLNIGRYNLGGGDAVTDDLQPNPNTEFYGLDGERAPSYSGSKMSVSTQTYSSSVKWTRTDRDFGLLKGAEVGTQKEIGWIGPMDGSVGNADMLTYTVNADEAGSYKVKLLVKLVGDRSGRCACIQINRDASTRQTISADEVGKAQIAATGNTGLYLVTFENVALNKGENTIQIGGSPEASNTYMYDFLGMAIVDQASSLEDGTADPGLHQSHIIRSDSAVPGYCKDVTPLVISDEMTLEDYKAAYDRVDEQCGYAWNYDWNADSAQLNVLKAASAASGEEFIAEIFSNSPPYFMTESLCSSGNYSAGEDNLRPDSYNAFAVYMADVIEHLKEEGITFQSASAFNEPNTSYWGAYSTKQEGCHFDADTISAILVLLNEKLEEKGIDLILSGSDETSIDTQITVYNALSDEAKAVIDRIDTHTYGGSKRSELSALARSENKNLWMSEVDGGFTAGSSAGEMSAALGLGQRIITDLSGLNCSAWIFWNLIDKHADNSEYGQSWISSANGVDKASLEDLGWYGQTGGYWGVAAADHNSSSLALSMKYYGFGQFTRYIRPGSAILSADSNTICAYDPDSKELVIVAINDQASDQNVQFSLSDFSGTPDSVQAIRTSGSLEDGEKWADVTDKASISMGASSFTASLKSNSITTFIVENVGLPKSMEETPIEKVVTSEMPASLLDDDLETTAPLESGAYVYDLGTLRDIASIRFAPDTNSASACVNAVFAGSVDGETWTNLYTVADTPAADRITEIDAADFASENVKYRYIRYISPAVSSGGRLSEFQVYALPEAKVRNLTTDLDFALEEGDSAFADLSGNDHLALITDISASDIGSYPVSDTKDVSVLCLDGSGYVTLPSGTIEDGESFTISMLAWVPEVSNHWMLTLGSQSGEWPNVDNYFFVTPSSNQSSHKGKLLAAISQSGETRLPAPANNQTQDEFCLYTIVSDGSSLKVYVNDTEVTSLDHSKDWKQILSGSINGYLGKSLYNPDPLFSGAIASFKVWNTALSAGEISELNAEKIDSEDVMNAAVAKFLLNGNSDVLHIRSNLTLPASIYGQKISWEIPEDSPINSDGSLKELDKPTPFILSYSVGNKKYSMFMMVLPEDPNEVVTEAAANLSIPNADNIKGNITLPDTFMKASVKWSVDEAGKDLIDLESKPSTVEGYDAIPAGVVHRPAADTNVVLRAEISYGDVTTVKTFPLTIRAAVEQKETTDYLFAYFTGEGASNGEQLYFSASQDGLNWTDLNDGKPSLTSSLGEKGIRDPYILRSPEGDKFYIIATDLRINNGNSWENAQTKGSQSLLVWESDDLVSWSEPRLVKVSDSIEAGCTWAPECFYDELTGEYVVYWSSKVAGDNYAKQRVYYAKTRDFYTFTKPKIWIEKDQSTIDTTVIKHDSTYYRLSKNEGGSTNQDGALTKTIFLEKSDTLLGDYSFIKSDSLNSNQYVEGPAIYKLNSDDSTGDQWILLADDFGGIGYYPLSTTDLEGAVFETVASGYKLPTNARHGTPIAITAEEYDRIMLADSRIEPVNTWFTSDSKNGLPESVSIGHSQYAASWNSENLWASHKAFDTVTVFGTALIDPENNTSVSIEASVQLIPENMEYMIDCNNPQSLSHANALASSSLMRNEISEQIKTDDNAWGSISPIGESGRDDMTAFSQTSLSNPYTGGYWARGGKSITYAMTLPAGDHTIYTGVKGWWNMGRSMKLTVAASQKTYEFTGFNPISNTESLYTGNIHLEKEETITLTISKTDSNDPILSWIGASLKTSPDKSKLIELIETAVTKNEDDYTAESFAALATALQTAVETKQNPDADAQAVSSAQTDLQTALNGLKKVYSVSFVANEKTIKTVKVEEGSSAESQAPASGDLRLPAHVFFQGWLPAFGAVSADTTYTAKLLDASALAEQIKQIEEANPSQIIDATHLYSKTSWDALQTQLDKAKTAVDQAAAADQDAIDQMVRDLSAAQSALKTLDLSALKNAVDRIEAAKPSKTIDESRLYSDESWNALQNKLAAAKDLLNSVENTTEETIDQTLRELNAADENLVILDLFELQIAVQYADRLDLSGFSSCGQDDLKTALRAGKSLLESPTDQDAIDKAADHLSDVLLFLRKSPEKSALDDLRV